MSIRRLMSEVVRRDQESEGVGVLFILNVVA